MAIPASVLYPPFNIVRLSHIVLTVTDLEAARAFYADTLGLQVTAEDNSRIYLRALEERGHHCIILEKGSTGLANELGFKVFDEDHLDRAKAFFEGMGLPTKWVDVPYQGRTFRTRDPLGIPLEFYAQMDRLPPIHQKYSLYKGVRPLRIDHFNCFSPDVRASVGFYNSLGFRMTEYTDTEDGSELWAAWMHRKGGVHDIAFTNGLGPRLHHVAFWVPTPLNIIDLLDVMSTTGYVGNIERGPGRHGISNAFFLYIRDRDGHRTEIYCSDYQTVDPDLEPIRWDLKDPQRQTLWGAPAPRSWFEEGSLFRDVSPAASKLKATPIVAP
ncbi:Extradiol ring-cleavage dioxygenase:Glyoxalase/Bleomycin resistance protein/dioxygenase domain:Glyoxalase I [Bradyrhizobium sp. STM 3843]|uniref:3,4-dihydroxyphenylacetate 2,3-dioxygenase n=1 Tax=Bradyrhizobium sp. STM 3843 TaxID=551947 RepID=UPI00024035BD|nr:3,4-dihydroxyphenylacetate 2,3-dioxygenase [Bradyrhizobium sp. STM 3843]CCE10782.1 Extradiol ring-cleavage dioxygenase:Glyoxalase/Bleomycin resistance protein/dioxygenase domain:Glyoxalase I [Bradyrhizobium sp. STM 3843]